MTKKLIILSHLCILLAFFSNPTYAIRPALTKVAVHIKSQTPSSIVQSAKNKPISKPHTAPVAKKQPTNPQKATKPTSKKPIETKKITKKELPQKKEVSYEQINKETIAKILEKIDKLEKKTNDNDIAVTSPSSQPIVSQTVEDPGEISDVMEYLFEILELPGPGQVTVEMFLSQDGKVDKITILESESPENSEYLILKLKNIVLPFHKKGLVPSSMKVCFSNLKA